MNLGFSLKKLGVRDEARTTHRRPRLHRFLDADTERFQTSKKLQGEIELWRRVALFCFMDWFEIKGKMGRTKGNLLNDKITARHFLESEFYSEVRELIGFPPFDPDMKLTDIQRLILSRSI